MEESNLSAANSETAASERESLNRRTFVVSGAFALAAFSSGIHYPVVSVEAAPMVDLELFRTLCIFLTDVPDLDSLLAERAFSQLTALDADFSTQAGTVADAVTASAAPSMDDFLARSALSDQGLRDTIVTIVSAWYLGYTGTPISLRAEDDTGFVTFTKALMYEPTIDATVRPTYARAGLNYWVEPPSFVTPPPAPTGIKSWGRDSPQGVGAIPVTPAPPGEEPTPSPPPVTEP